MNEKTNLPMVGDYYDIITKVASVKDVDIVKLKELMDIRENYLLRRAEEHWNEQMAHAQGDMAAVSKDSANPATRSTYASLAAIDNAIRAIYTKHGFSISFDEVPMERDNWIHIRADVSCGGFTRRYHRFLPWSSMGAQGRAAMTATHANMGANTYIRRALLKNIFNLAEEDDDGVSAGGKVAPKQPVRVENNRWEYTDDRARTSHQYAADMIDAIREIKSLEKLRTFYGEHKHDLNELDGVDADAVDAVFKEKAESFKAAQ